MRGMNESHSHSRRAVRDNVSALTTQVSDLFSHISASTRTQRTTIAYEGLLEVLVKYAKELHEIPSLQHHIFDSVRTLAATSGYEKAMRALSIVQDANIMDHNAKRAQCTSTCAKLLLDCTCESDCALVLVGIRSIIAECTFSVGEVISAVFDVAMNMFKSSQTPARAAALQVITSVVMSHAPQLRSMKSVTDALRVVSPSYLVRETINTDDAWFRKWSSKLLIELLRHAVFEIKSENAEALVRDVEAQLANADDNEDVLKGILTLVTDFASWKPLAQAFSWNPKKWRACVMDTRWGSLSENAQVLGVQATLALTNVRISDFVEDATSALLAFLEVQPAAAAAALCELLRTSASDVPRKTQELLLLSACRALSISDPNEEHGELLGLIQRVATTEHHTVLWDEVVEPLLSRGKHNIASSILAAVPEMFSEKRDALLEKVDWAELIKGDAIVGLIKLAKQLHQVACLPHMLSGLRHESVAIREVAATHIISMCEHIIAAQAAEEDPTNLHRLDNVVTNAVEKLLDSAVADVNPRIRCLILSRLAPAFDPYLSLPDNLESVFMSRSDVDVSARNAALHLLCRVLPSHPAFVQPPLFRAQEYALKEIEIRDATVAESIYAAQTLRQCAKSHGMLLSPRQVEAVVLERLSKHAFVCRSLTLEFLKLLREILDNSGPQNHADAAAFVGAIVPVITDGHTPTLRAAGLETLAAVVRGIGIPVDSALFNYVYHTCGKILVNDSNEEDDTRKAAAFVLSVIGAINPVKIRSVTRSADIDTSTAEDTNNDLLIQHKPHPRSHPHMAERYPSIVLYLLVNTMQAASDSNQQRDALRCAYDTLQASPANQKTSLMAQLVPQLRRWLAEPEKANLYEYILKILTDLSSLLRQFKDTVPQHLGTDILKSLQLFCQQPHASQKPLNALVVELLDELARGLPVQDIREHRWAVEFVHQRLSRDKDDVALTLRVVKALDAFSTFLHEKDMRHVIPHVLECIDVPRADAEPKDTLVASASVVAARQVNATCFDFLSMITQRHVNLAKELCAQIVHDTIRFMEEVPADEDRHTALQFLATLVTTIGRAAQRFIDPIQSCASSKGMPEDSLKQLIHALENGTQKIKLPPAKQEEALSPDLPLMVVSQLPGLTRHEFEQEMTTALKLDERDIEVLGVSHPGGQTVVHFRFVTTENVEQRLHQFVRKANDTQSHLKRSLGIVSVEQRKHQSFRMSADMLLQLATLPDTKVKRKKEFTWLQWAQTVCLGMLRGSPFQPFRVLGTLTPPNMWVVKEVFPFAAGAVLGQVDVSERLKIMQFFNQTLLKAPNDIRLLLFSLAEYLESERGEKKVVLNKVAKQVTCVVERESPEQKFGINYDQDARGIIVTKLAPDGPGQRAKVPVQGVLLTINGQKVRAVQDITGMIRGLMKITLVFSVMEEQRVVPESKPLMDLAEVARAASDSEYHAKAIYFYEVLLDQCLKNLEGGKSRMDTEAQQILQVVESLMKCYNRLGLSMEGKGVAKVIAVKFTENIIAPEQFGFDEAGTLEQLQWWSDALRLYRSKKEAVDGSINLSSFLGMLRCYDALGDVPTLRKIVDEHWDTLDNEARLSVAPFRASAALALCDWEAFDAAASMKPDSLGMIERGAYLFRHGTRESVIKFIKDERDARFDRFCETFDDSYLRCYDVLVDLQHLTHFEEVLQYRDCAGDERRALLRNLWRKRAVNLSRQPHVWKTMIGINSLVLSQEEDLLNRVDAVVVCSKQGWSSYSEVLLERLLGTSDINAIQLTQKDPHVIHAYLKHTFTSNRRVEAYKMLSEVLATTAASGTAVDGPKSDIWGKCWLLLGEWTVQLNAADVPHAIEALTRATELSPKSSNAFHSLGILHYEQSRNTGLPLETRHMHCVSAVGALISSVQLSSDGKNSVMQDMLRILALWFAHGHVQLVNDAVQTNMTVIPDDVWLRVIPQLIARMGINSSKAREMLTELLIRVGSRYPHAFIYPLTVSEKSTELVRRKVAERVLSGIRQSCDQLVKDASTISSELVRMAILWGEKWHSQIQAAAAKQDDAAEILRILQPLYDELDHPTTPNEKNFEKSYGISLKRAKTALASKAMDQAWQLLKQVYSSVSKQLSERKLQMNDVSPVLDAVHRSIVAVPGTFDPAAPLISITRFHQKIVVMPSKQKPRRFGLEGSDGKTYRFLLKGHEDLRQDERVMQFLDLINTIFAGDSASTSLELFVPRYAVVPLTDNVGLIGWVENTDTIYRLLESRRQDYNISIYEEVNLIQQRGGLKQIDDYHRLPKPERKALLAYAMQNTPADELARILWDKNDACEQWLEHRRLYAHTLAIMSMVGYVLGLGDRHLNNLMLQQGGAVVHIDFGDCFEVAMHRSLYAEAVPFRLTRILVNALGVSGVDGVYRHTCEHVMKLLRRHKENLLSILEAFIYDPLINWKLTIQPKEDGGGTTRAEVTGAEEPAVLAGAAEASNKQQPALSCPVRKNPITMSKSVISYDGEQELRNQQAHVALLRVHLKLSGQDFVGKVSGAATSGGAAAALHNVAAPLPDRPNVSEFFGESLKDSVAGPLLATYLSQQIANATGGSVGNGSDTLEVPQQVERLIQEATSLDNLSEAFITGWAPFW